MPVIPTLKLRQENDDAHLCYITRNTLKITKLFHTGDLRDLDLNMVLEFHSVLHMFLMAF